MGRFKLDCNWKAIGSARAAIFIRPEETPDPIGSRSFAEDLWRFPRFRDRAPVGSGFSQDQKSLAVQRAARHDMAYQSQ